jgi:hypothetical protein
MADTQWFLHSGNTREGYTKNFICSRLSGGKERGEAFLMSVSGGGRPGDAPDRPPPTQGWGVLSNNLPPDLSHSDEWDDFSSQGGAWVARD